jgi:hypothetical protein
MFYDDDAVLSHFERCSAPRLPNSIKIWIWLNLQQKQGGGGGRVEAICKKIFPLRPLPPSTRMFKTCSDFVTQYIVMNSNKYLYKFRTCATSTNSIQHAINYRHAFTDQLVSVHCKMQCIVFYHKNTLMLTFKRSILMLNVFNLAYCQASNDLFDYIYYLLSLLF